MPTPLSPKYREAAPASAGKKSPSFLFYEPVSCSLFIFFSIQSIHPPPWEQHISAHRPNPEPPMSTPRLPQHGEAATESAGKKPAPSFFYDPFSCLLFIFFNSINMSPSTGITFLCPQTQPQTTVANTNATFATAWRSSDRKCR